MCYALKPLFKNARGRGRALGQQVYPPSREDKKAVIGVSLDDKGVRRTPRGEYVNPTPALILPFSGKLRVESDAGSIPSDEV